LSPTSPTADGAKAKDPELMAKKMAAGKERRLKEAAERKAREEAFAAAGAAGEPDQEALEDPDAPEPDPLPSRTHYVLLSILSAFFISLPMGEEVIDWVQVGAFAVVNVAWVGYFHRATGMHGLLYFLLNFILIQWNVVMESVPVVMEHVDPTQAAIGAAINAVAVFVIWWQYVRHLPSRSQYDAWDWIACVLALANVVILVAIGVIPMRVVYHVFKTLVGLLTNFSVQQ
jgi:hypothetical protein